MAISKGSDREPIDLENAPISPTAISMIPKEVAKENLLVPIEFKDGVLTVASPIPDLITIEQLVYILGVRVEMVLARREQVDRALERFYPSKA